MSDLPLSKLSDDYKRLSWKAILVPRYTLKHSYRLTIWAVLLFLYSLYIGQKEILFANTSWRKCSLYLQYVHLYKHANTIFDSKGWFNSKGWFLFLSSSSLSFLHTWEFDKNLKQSKTHLTFNSCYSKWLKVLTIIFFFINKNSITVKCSRLILHELYFCHFSAETWQHFMAKKKLVLCIFFKHFKIKRKTT